MYENLILFCFSFCSLWPMNRISCLVEIRIFPQGAKIRIRSDLCHYNYKAVQAGPVHQVVQFGLHQNCAAVRWAALCSLNLNFLPPGSSAPQLSHHSRERFSPNQAGYELQLRLPELHCTSHLRPNKFQDSEKVSCISSRNGKHIESLLKFAYFIGLTTSTKYTTCLNSPTQ